MLVKRIVLALGAIAIIVGVAGLLTSVSIDPEGRSVSCGSAVSADLSEARAQQPTTTDNARIDGDLVVRPDYVALCRQELDDRRLWTLTLCGLGVLAVAVPAVMTLASRRRASA
ncbi:hypothetical protein GR927_20535 [Mycolicibacterium sp. 3033]|nr:hypothetical protein [Mycolicibacterium aurantiacum]